MTLSQNFGFLFCRECVGWFGSMCMGSLVFFDLSQPSPALVRSYRNTHHLTGLGQTGSSSTSLTYQQYSITAILDRKSTRLNSSHVRISYAVFCLKKKT